MRKCQLNSSRFTAVGDWVAGGMGLASADVWIKKRNRGLEELMSENERESESESESERGLRRDWKDGWRSSSERERIEKI